MCSVKKISPLAVKYFTNVIVVMAYIFNFLLVVTVVYNGCSCFYIENFQH